ncbi:hypothetical protein KZX46_20870 [Polymorphobacter sp. PAMC 29334]|uniref:hypothetical protein n=1 Tax=Polymorphobacter sp. PAMC 29334 TaxID=2862331 RepID=UPI001C75AC0D|nr:hypothetical protein [Polymorphobacter sp. PAMC 29334]QYE35132.1 hypothetical protein KZX46_20870 [Polymorphobacter sp. PAMC 29334]
MNTEPLRVTSINLQSKFVSEAALRELIASSGPNKNDQAIVAIIACLDAGITTEREIIGMLGSVGLSHGHVAMILKKNAGSEPARHHWYRDAAGHYSEHG